MRIRLLKIMVLLGCHCLAFPILSLARAEQLPDLVAPRATALRPDPGSWPGDPFAGKRPSAPLKAPAARSVATAKNPVLRGILIGARGRYALFDGQAATIGEVVGGARVVKIERDRVELESASGRQVLRVFPGKDGF